MGAVCVPTTPAAAFVAACAIRDTGLEARPAARRGRGGGAPVAPGAGEAVRAAARGGGGGGAPGDVGAGDAVREGGTIGDIGAGEAVREGGATGTCTWASPVVGDLGSVTGGTGEAVAESGRGAVEGLVGTSDDAS
jgi:hypothetical protein